MEIDKAKAFHFPNGAYLKIENSEGDVNSNEKDDRHWCSLDISLVFPSGFEELLCCFDYEDQRGLRIVVYESEGKDPIFERKVRCDSGAINKRGSSKDDSDSRA